MLGQYRDPDQHRHQQGTQADQGRARRAGHRDHPDGRYVYVSSGKRGFPGTVCGEGTPRPANTVSVIGTATNKVVKTIRAGKYPGAIAITPDGKTAYVLSHRGVVPIRTSTGTPGNAIKAAATDGALWLMAITPNGKMLYATSGDSLLAIRTAAGKVVKTIKFQNEVRAIAITPDSKTIYVISYDWNNGSGTLTAIRTATNTIVKTIKAGRSPIAIAITPDGKTAYVVSGGSVFPVRTATNTPGKPIRTGADLSAIAITPGGKIAYVTGCSAARRAGIVIPIRTATNTPGKPITVKTSSGYDVLAIGITPNGKTAYLLDVNDLPTSGPGTVIPVRTATGTVGTPVKVAEGPAAIVFTP